MDHFKGQRSNFSLQNIEFCVEKLFGLAKYPINIWNLLELTSNDLKYNLNNQKLKLNLFLKSAMSILSATMMNAGGVLNSSSSKNWDRYGEASALNNVLTSNKVFTVEGVFQRMIKVNNMENYEYDNMVANPFGYMNQQSGYMCNLFSRNNQRMNHMDQLSVNQISAKHMNYNQMMLALGKGKRVDIDNYFKKLNDQKNERKKDGLEDNVFNKLDKSKLRKKAKESKQGSAQQ